MTLGNLGRNLRDALTGVVGGAGDVVGSTIEVARTTTVAALQGSPVYGNGIFGLVGDVMKGAIQATNEVGTELASTAKGRSLA